MQIVIDIPDRIKYGIDNDITVNGSQASQIVMDAVKNGIVLSKGHGRLIDADAVLEEPIGNTYKDIDIAETIIEADKESEGKV